MSHKKYFTLGLLPVLGLMMLSPSSVKKMHSGRGIASTKSNLLDFERSRQLIHEQAIRGTLPPAEVVKTVSHPRYDRISQQYQSENKHVVDNELSRELYLRNLEGIADLIADEAKTFNPELKDLTKIRELESRIEGEVHAISKAEKDLEDLKTRTLIKSDDVEKPENTLADAKLKLEGLLKGLDAVKVGLEEIKPEAKSEVVAVTVVEAKPEVKEVIETKEEKIENEEKPKVGSREARKQRAEEKSEMYDLLCELRDQLFRPGPPCRRPRRPPGPRNRQPVERLACGAR